jgi:hypothetical protein
LIVGAVLLGVWHLEAVHNAYREGFTDAMTYEKKSPTKEAVQEVLKETNEINI